jgi:uncharacterized protein involved in exopolysaccharide biosynthesis
MGETSATPAIADDDEISLLDLAIVLAKHKKLILGLPFLAGVVALVVALLLPKIYTATARILPPQQKESSASAMLGVLTGASAGAGASVGQALGLRNPNDLYAGILKGHTIADRIIERFKLKELYEAKTLVAARQALSNASRINAGRDGLISIEVDDEDPKRAADMANAYFEELDHLMQGLAVTEAGQRRLFFEKQLASAQDKLVAAEAALRQAIQTKGITGVDAQSRAVVGTTEQLRAQIAVKEIQLDAMRTFATERNPEALRLRQEISSMKSELGKLEGGRPEVDGGRSPAGLENIRKVREMKFLEFTVELLTKQYEIAKIDEAKDAVIIQVVDKAMPPDYKSKPKRALIVVLTVLVFGIFAVLWAFFREAMDKARADPRGASRLKVLRNYLRLGVGAER